MYLKLLIFIFAVVSSSVSIFAGKKSPMTPGVPIYIEMKKDIRHSRYYQFNEEISYSSIVSVLEKVDACKTDISMALSFRKKVKDYRIGRIFYPESFNLYYKTRKAQRVSICYVHSAIYNYNQTLKPKKVSQPDSFSPTRKVKFIFCPKYSIYKGKKLDVSGFAFDIALQYNSNIYGANFHFLLENTESEYDRKGYENDGAGAVGGFLTCKRNIIEIDDFLGIDVGFCAGFLSYGYSYSDYSVWPYSFIDYNSYLFGGPTINFSIGLRRVFLFSEYTFLLGTSIGQMLSIGIKFKI